MGSEPEDQEASAKTTRVAAEQFKALDTLTDHVEEKELDQAKVNKAMNNIMQNQAAEREAQRLREKDLAGVKIDVKDIKIMASEFEIDLKTAERRLREHRGDIVAALGSFL